MSKTARLHSYTWAPLALFCFHIFASEVLHLYRLFPNFDIPMHFLGGVAIAYFFSGTLKLLFKPKPALHKISVFAWATTSAVLWEFSEFILDYFFASSLQFGLTDTMGDLFMGMLGALALLIFTD